MFVGLLFTCLDIEGSNVLNVFLFLKISQYKRSVTELIVLLQFCLLLVIITLLRAPRFN